MKMANFSSTLARKMVVKTTLIGCIAMAGTGVSADVRVAAFSEGRGFHSLMSGDLELAQKALPKHGLRNLDYADANNLCVLQILQENEAAAVQTCRKALNKVEETTMKRTAMKKVKAEIYANLAAAEMLGGHYPEAQRSLDKALSLSKTPAKAVSNAAENQRALRSRLLAAN
jgi:hypothetical protein